MPSVCLTLWGKKKIYIYAAMSEETVRMKGCLGFQSKLHSGKDSQILFVRTSWEGATGRCITGHSVTHSFSRKFQLLFAPRQHFIMTPCPPPKKLSFGHYIKETIAKCTQTYCQVPAASSVTHRKFKPSISICLHVSECSCMHAHTCTHFQICPAQQLT